LNGPEAFAEIPLAMSLLDRLPAARAAVLSAAGPHFCAGSSSAVHDACVGAGVELVAACDIQCCSKDSTFVLKEVDMAIVDDIVRAAVDADETRGKRLVVFLPSADEVAVVGVDVAGVGVGLGGRVSLVRPAGLGDHDGDVGGRVDDLLVGRERAEERVVERDYTVGAHVVVVGVDVEHEGRAAEC
jgi:hypothetical protein